MYHQNDCTHWSFSPPRAFSCDICLDEIKKKEFQVIFTRIPTVELQEVLWEKKFAKKTAFLIEIYRVANKTTDEGWLAYLTHTSIALWVQIRFQRHFLAFIVACCSRAFKKATHSWNEIKWKETRGLIMVCRVFFVWFEDKCKVAN